jgi:putative addiction module antidote
MTKVVKLRRAGGSISATLPRSMAERLNVDVGDEVFLVETERGILITPFDPNFEAELAAFEAVRKQYRNTLRKLAE